MKKNFIPVYFRNIIYLYAIFPYIVFIWAIYPIALTVFFRYIEHHYVSIISNHFSILHFFASYGFLLTFLLTCIFLSFNIFVTFHVTKVGWDALNPDYLNEYAFKRSKFINFLKNTVLFFNIRFNGFYLLICFLIHVIPFARIIYIWISFHLKYSWNKPFFYDWTNIVGCSFLAIISISPLLAYIIKTVRATLSDDEAGKLKEQKLYN